jgi:hypothetical protein
MSTNLLEQVVAECLERGRHDGRAEMARLLLRRYLEAHFGGVPTALEARIAAADALTALFDRAACERD